MSDLFLVAKKSGQKPTEPEALRLWRQSVTQLGRCLSPQLVTLLGVWGGRELRYEAMVDDPLSLVGFFRCYLLVRKRNQLILRGLEMIALLLLLVHIYQ